MIRIWKWNVGAGNILRGAEVFRIILIDKAEKYFEGKIISNEKQIER